MPESTLPANLHHLPTLKRALLQTDHKPGIMPTHNAMRNQTPTMPTPLLTIVWCKCLGVYYCTGHDANHRFSVPGDHPNGQLDDKL